MTISTQDKVSKKAEPDSAIPNPADGNRIYKVLNTFTDSRGARWQTDQNFVCDDEAELKMRLDKGEIRADGEPQHHMDASGEWPDPNWEKARDLARKRGEPLPPHPAQRQAEQQARQQAPDKSRA